MRAEIERLQVVIGTLKTQKQDADQIRELRQRVTTLQESIAARDQVAGPVVIETPSPPQVVRTDVLHHQYQGPNDEARAWQFAVNQLLERQPAMLATVERLQALKAQYEAGVRLSR